jgi:uncharacterized protein YbcC (UPF0753/DUF2309 family)
MIEVHDPVRLLVIAEHFPEKVMYAISKNPATYEWFKNDWVKLVAVQPKTKELFVFEDENFVNYDPIQEVNFILDELKLAEITKENLPVGIITNTI